MLLKLSHGLGRFRSAWASPSAHLSTLSVHCFDLRVKPCVRDRLGLVAEYAEILDRIVIECRSKHGSINLFPAGLILTQGQVQRMGNSWALGSGALAC